MRKATQNTQKQPVGKGKEQPPPPPKEFSINDYVKDGLSREDVVDFKTAFDMFDCDNQGRVEVSELKEAFINLGFHQQSTFSERVFDYMSGFNGGKVDFEGFIKLATTRLNDKYTKEECDLIFSAFDYKNSGNFNIYDLKDTIRDLGMDIDEDEI